MNLNYYKKINMYRIIPQIILSPTTSFCFYLFVCLFYSLDYLEFLQVSGKERQCDLFDTKTRCSAFITYVRLNKNTHSE